LTDLDLLELPQLFRCFLGSLRQLFLHLLVFFFILLSLILAVLVIVIARVLLLTILLLVALGRLWFWCKDALLLVLSLNSLNSFP